MGNSNALFICAAASSQLTDAEVTASMYRFSLETCCTRQRICCLHRGFVISDITRAVCPAFSAGQRSCAVTHTRDGCTSLGAVLGTGTSVWELCLPFPAHINISEKYQFDLERDRNKYRMGKGTGKRKIAWLEGEGEKWPRKGKWRQTERQRKSCFSFYEEREPSNQDDWVQLFRPLYTHELAIKCGSGKQKTS